MGHSCGHSIGRKLCKVFGTYIARFLKRRTLSLCLAMAVLKRLFKF
jgi:hypothetical protein